MSIRDPAFKSIEEEYNILKWYKIMSVQLKVIISTIWLKLTFRSETAKTK